MVAPTTTPTMIGSRFNWCLPITLSMRYFVEAGRIKPLARLIIIKRKLPPRSRRRGLTSFQTSGRTFYSLGLGRAAVRSATVARPVPREGRSADFIPGEPKLEWPKEDILVEVYPFGRFGARVAVVSSHIGHGSSMFICIVRLQHLVLWCASRAGTAHSLSLRRPRYRII